MRTAFGTATLFIFLILPSVLEQPLTPIAVDKERPTGLSFQSLKNFVPKVEIIWGDEDNDEALFLKFIKYKNDLFYNSNFTAPKYIDDEIAIVEGTRFQAAEVWNETEGAPTRVKTFTNATLSEISPEGDFLTETGNIITLKRAEILPQKNFVIDVDPGEYLLDIYLHLPEREILASYEAQLKILSSSSD